MASDLFEVEEDEVASSGGSFIHLSDTFKFISHYRRQGHQIGRKVGDMLEVLTLAALHRNADLKKRLVVEPKLEGFSGAAHKVEFAIHNLNDRGAPIKDIPNLLSFIECKKVGVEQTINKTHKDAFEAVNYLVPYRRRLSIRFKPRWTSEATIYIVEFTRTRDLTTVLVERDGAVVHQTEIQAPHRLMFGLTNDGSPFFIDNQSSLRGLNASIRLCKILEVSSIGESGVTAKLNDCLPGPQTPEKAKQASFVALDVRKGRFGQFDKRPNERECVSILVLTEFSHWELKSVNMVKACLDYTLVVDDEMVVDAIRQYEAEYGVEFLTRITKEFFLSSPEARVIASRIVEQHDGRIFRDIADNTKKQISFDGQAVIVAR